MLLFFSILCAAIIHVDLLLPTLCAVMLLPTLCAVMLLPTLCAVMLLPTLCAVMLLPTLCAAMLLPTLCAAMLLPTLCAAMLLCSFQVVANAVAGPRFVVQLTHMPKVAAHRALPYLATRVAHAVPASLASSCPVPLSTIHRACDAWACLSLGAMLSRNWSFYYYY